MNADGSRRVVVHVSDDPGDLDRAVSTAQSLRDAFPDAEVRVIVNGPALDGLREGQAPPGVEACAIGLQRRGIDAASLRAVVEVIPSAATVLVEAQFEGAAYIRI
ncbi:MAG: hypothetical protein ABS62_04840 [Microbacterium sp. SCN 70-200]|uniref:DsrE family protein n=1 Tax=unclassified Microbacterium TaxID=2609290 RepID=UPI00086DB872|nr:MULTISPECIES: hypothetical protein [unclassified Microbacterium]MBN9216224.1 hypothetical protein [Microbacterium sp.]ODT41792.1 MAG: hypothetical protein ABS62_04840 [Microbacterium sp. SCN 70-200]OJV84481.1 MAG: hypothetical protein BGO46_06085 [Microbacterium sp. 70-16]